MNKAKKAILDVLYCIVSVGMMNVVLQFVVNPVINSKIGEDAFGEVLFLVALMNILAPSFGLGTGNTRLVFPHKDDTTNRDYVGAIGKFAIVSILVTVVVMLTKNYVLYEIAFFSIIMGIAVFRNYAFVEYRISLNYKKQFFFYLLLSVGYIAGIGIFLVTGMWEFVYLLGETFALLFVAFTGSIFNKIKECSEYKEKVIKNSMSLSSSYLLTNSVSNLDRIVLMYGVGSVAVSQYYVVSLIGKIIAIVSGPINSVLIGYLAKYGIEQVKKIYNKMLVLICGGGILLYGLCCVATPIFIKLLYPNMYKDVIHLNFVVNAAQILYFLTGIVLTTILAFADTNFQLKIRTTYSVIFVLGTLIGTYFAGIVGFAYASLIANVVYFVMTICIGIVCSKKEIIKE